MPKSQMQKVKNANVQNVKAKSNARPVLICPGPTNRPVRPCLVCPGPTPVCLNPTIWSRPTLFRLARSQSDPVCPVPVPHLVPTVPVPHPVSLCPFCPGPTFSLSGFPPHSAFPSTIPESRLSWSQIPSYLSRSHPPTVRSVSVPPLVRTIEPSNPSF